jgi:DNA-binding FrmR family transcriptional regulator
MAHTIQGKKQLLTRVRRIKGQADALERALGEETACMAVLQQIAAIRGAVNGLMSEVLEGHIREHLGAAEVPALQRSEDVDAVVAALRSYLR